MTFEYVPLIVIIILWIYFFLETGIYLALWAAIAQLIVIVSKVLSIEDGYTRIIIVVYCLMIFLGYFYKLKGSIFKISNYRDKLAELRSDMRRLKRMSIVSLLIIFIGYLLGSIIFG
jgi:hypothetical protein